MHSCSKAFYFGIKQLYQNLDFTFPSMLGIFFNTIVGVQ